MLNVDRLLEELQFITVNPDKHDQALWAEAVTEVPIPEDADPYEVNAARAPRPSACGSFGCLAGNTAIHEPDVELDWYRQTYRREGGKKVQVWQADNILGEYVTVEDDWDGSKYQEKKSIATKAQELLGLTPFQAGRLFDGDNDLDRLWELADAFSGGEIRASKSEYDRWDDHAYAHALKLRDEKEEAKA